MQITINSANIATFGSTVTFDPYARTVSFNTATLTSYKGSGISAVLGIAISLVDQDGVELLKIDWTAPQITPSISQQYTLDLSALNVAFFFQTYKIVAAIKDSTGIVYETPPVYKKVCQPVGLNESGYVAGLFYITPDCVNNTLTVKEGTPLVYNNLTPSSVSKAGTLYYPTGTISSLAFTGTPFSNNVIYTGSYKIACETVAGYSLGDDVYVNVTYITNNVFDVTCANKIADLMCCIVGIQNTYLQNCDNATGKNAKNQLDDISIHFLIGLTKEINGQDASFEADLIKKQLNCNCGVSSIQQNELNPINPSVYNIVLQGVGGTTVPGATVVGSTKTFNIASNVYQVVKGNTLDTAFTIQIDTSVSHTVKYKITFDYNILASSILTAIAADNSLINQLNSLVTGSGNVSLVGLNGRCVVDLTKSDYVLSQVVNNSTLVVNITINGIIHAAPTGLFGTDFVGIAAWLNSLSLGAFSVSVNSGILLIQSTANSNVISTMTFTTPNVTTIFASTNKTLVQVLQAIIDYLCGLTTLQIALGSNLSLCLFDYNGVPIQYSYGSSDSQGAFNLGISQSICNIVDRINTLTGVTCDTLKGIFLDRPGVSFGGSDRLYGTLGGNCAGLTDQQVANMVLAAVGKYSDVKTAFCAIDCTTPGTCPDISNINTSSTNNSSVGIYGVTFGSTASGSQTLTVRYRISGTTTWTISTNSLLVFANGNISGSSPYLINGLSAGTTYDISIFNNCGGSGFQKQATVPANTVYSGSFLRDTVIYNICGDSPVTLFSSVPFATGVTMYTDAGLTTILTGYTFIAPSAGGNIFTLNSTTGVVGTDTGNQCNSGTPGVYILGNNAGTVCSQPSATLYTNGAFATGKILYHDNGLTSIVTGYTFVVNTAINHIFNLNSSTGVVGSDTGTLCSGTASLYLTFANGGGSFLSFGATLSQPIDANITVNQEYADGFSDSLCSSSISSAQRNTPIVILAGNTSNSGAPDTVTGVWASAIKYRIYNVIINGTAHVNGDVVTIGSYSVTINIPSCA